MQKSVTKTFSLILFTIIINSCASHTVQDGSGPSLYSYKGKEMEDIESIKEIKGVITLIGSPKDVLYQALFEGFSGTKQHSSLIPRERQMSFRNSEYYKELFDSSEFQRYVKIIDDKSDLFGNLKVTVELNYHLLRKELEYRGFIKEFGL